MLKKHIVPCGVFSGPYSNLYKTSLTKFPSLQSSTAFVVPHGDAALKIVRGPTNDEFVGWIITRLEQMVAEQVILKHDRVCAIIGLVMIQDNPAVVTQFQDKGNVMDYISGNPSANKALLILDTAHGLAYLHNMGMIHANINTNNILIDDKERACLTDVGFSFLMRDSTGKNHTIPASWQYKPREELNPVTTEAFRPTFPMDVYAFGSVMYEILCGRLPYRGGRYIYRDVREIIEHGHIALPKAPQINDQMWSVIQKCWARDPNERPSMAQVVDELEQFILRDII